MRIFMNDDKGGKRFVCRILGQIDGRREPRQTRCAAVIRPIDPCSADGAQIGAVPAKLISEVNGGEGKPCPDNNAAAEPDRIQKRRDVDFLHITDGIVGGRQCRLRDDGGGRVWYGFSVRG